ncbi:MAG TPA: ABC transporter permease subunit [Acetobacteraceae bacterium]|nr:ABC transporter permease subunit [Acetobacteraceae bacterium]
MAAPRVTRLRLVAAALLLVLWEAASWSGLFYRGVLPSIVQILTALVRLLADPAFWWHLGTTAMEVTLALLIGGGLGIVVGVLVGGARFLRRAYEPALHYLAPTPKIVFLPILIALFGVGPSSKVAMGALSCFFPVALSVASGMTLVSPVHLRVARSFKFSTLRTLRSVYLPSLVAPMITGLRLGLGVAVIGCLLSEIKLSNRGLGFLAIQFYSQFRIPEMYAVLIVVFALAGLGNALFGRAAAQSIVK